jgi:hypothetical protein
MYASLKEKMFEPLQNVKITLFGNDGYERVCDEYDDEFGALDINNYGSSPASLPKKTTSGIRKVVLLVSIVSVAVITSAVIMSGSFKSGKSHTTPKFVALTSDNGELPAAEHTGDLNKYPKLGQVNPQAGELEVDLHSLGSKGNLEGMEINGTSSGSNAIEGQNLDLFRIRAQLMLQRKILDEKILNLQKEIDAAKK